MPHHTEEDWRDWTKTLFDALKIGGIWGYPATGLVYKKISDSEVILEALPPKELQPFPCTNWVEEHDKVVFYARPNYKVSDPHRFTEDK
jgi:hypothetical protein|tara:strand:+ start:262 stop:528 length:267 start_codon:yes stop_codon:yes gene_type:complete